MVNPTLLEARGGTATLNAEAGLHTVVETYSYTLWPQWSAVWSELFDECPLASVFLATSWVEAWLAVFGAQLDPRILVFRDPVRGVVGICVVVFRGETRGPFRVRRVYLNTAGEDAADEVCSESNGVLCRPGYESAVTSALGDWLAGQQWDECVCNAMSTPIEPPALVNCIQTRDEHPCYYVDLTAFPPTLDGFLAALSRNTREQVRRSLRLYAQRGGDLRVEPAATVDQAQRFLDQLAALHQASWQARGTSGAFSSDRFVAFNRTFVATAFPAGECQLWRIAAGDITIGILYYLVRGRRMYFYQSGLKREEERDNRLKPGLVAHASAIAYAAAAGFREYDFLAGDRRYKKTLSTGSRPLTWQIFERRNLKVATISLLRRLRDRVRGPA